ncbi:hypothetical protein L0244_28680 [bacterium]|nr:hypothetical protein [bacterium]
MNFNSTNYFGAVKRAAKKVVRKTSKAGKQECGGWENFLHITVEQQLDRTKCASVSRRELGYHVTIVVFPGGEPNCRFDFDVPKSGVHNVVRQFVQKYL